MRALQSWVLAGLLCGCATNPTPPAPSPVRTITARLPTFAPLAETKELQAKGGIQISAAPVAYQLVRSGKRAEQLAQPSFLEKLGGPNGWQYMRFVERSYWSELEVQPGQMRFIITINNQLPRVFRGAGTVVQFNVAGKLIPVEQEGYAALTNIIVPPRTQQQVEIFGPPLSAVPDQTTVGLFLYDVVTKTDAAGNISERAIPGQVDAPEHKHRDHQSLAAAGVAGISTRS